MLHFRAVALLCILCLPCLAEPVLTVARSARAGVWEEAAANDLARYLRLMTGTEVELLQGPPNSAERPVFLVGELALESLPELRASLASVQKKDPVFRSDAVVLRTEANRVYLAGSNDDSHYFAVSAYLHRQGCRWYLPTEIGECIPRGVKLSFQDSEELLAPPFEVRTYWISWMGDRTDYETFAHRNFYNLDRQVVGSHELGSMLPQPAQGQTLVLNSEATIQAVVSRLSTRHSQSQPLSLGISDATQGLRSEVDRRLSAGVWDKYFYASAAADAFLPFYNEVCNRLWKLHPDSRSKVGFLAYTNLTLPPQRRVTAAKPLIAFLAPIDIDPSHALTDPRSPERLDLFGALRRWVQVMEGRVVIYDYDQGMMVWRDVPNPSHQVFQQDVKTYRDLGILGFATESRNALATTFTNLHFRGQLMWNPELDLESELALFYQNFYGPAAEPMARYWNAICRSYAGTVMVDHEFYVIPSLYPESLIRELGANLQEAVASEEPYRSRLQMARSGFEVLRCYTEMVQAGAEECDYPRAVVLGQQGLAAREALTAQNGTFTTYKAMGESGPAWWPGEVETYAGLASLCDGSRGTLLARTPQLWSFRHDPFDHGLWRGWAMEQDFSGWESVSCGRLLRSQGVLGPEYHNPEGYGWYACRIQVPRLKGGERLLFPGLFNSSWLYLNGDLVDGIERKEPWWYNDYSFHWDVDVAGALRPGDNTIVLRTQLKQHPSGMFRRPFLYRKAKQ